jgi:hypothetical protein
VRIFGEQYPISTSAAAENTPCYRAQGAGSGRQSSQCSRKWTWVQGVAYPADVTSQDVRERVPARASHIWGASEIRGPRYAAMMQRRRLVDGENHLQADVAVDNAGVGQCAPPPAFYPCVDPAMTTRPKPTRHPFALRNRGRQPQI